MKLTAHGSMRIEGTRLQLTARQCPANWNDPDQPQQERPGEAFEALCGFLGRGLTCGWCGGRMLLGGPASLVAHGQSILMYYGNLPKKSPKKNGELRHTKHSDI
jgi:hypothetical protein